MPIDIWRSVGTAALDPELVGAYRNLLIAGRSVAGGRVNGFPRWVRSMLEARLLRFAIIGLMRFVILDLQLARTLSC